MKIWILLVIAVLLFAWSVYRERFEATASIKAPPYGDDEKVRLFDMAHQTSPHPPYTHLGFQDILMAKAKAANPDLAALMNKSAAEKAALSADDKSKLAGADRKMKIAGGGFLAPAVEAFFNTKYKPATTPITQADVDAFMVTRTSDLAPVEKDVLTTYFVNQSGATTNSDYASALASLGQTQGYLVPNTTPSDTGPVGASSGSTAANAASAGSTGATGGTGAAPSNIGTSGSTAATAGSTGASGSTTSMAPNSHLTGTTTGGSTASASGPNSGGGGDRRRQVFGPVFTSLGDPGPDAGDSASRNVYPQLLGGDPLKSSTRIDGAGIFPAKDTGSMWGLPSSQSLGSDENSKYLPSSRVPGDMDLIPDPYRVSQSFSATNYSFKTEPVPFLTDFSAFQK